MELKEIGKAVAFIILCQMAGLIGSIFTFEAIPGWYAGLVKPDFSPPNWVFGPVWTTLYAMMGIAAYLVYSRRKKSPDAMPALAIFAGQLILNTLWSVIFFGYKSPALAFACIIALAFMIAWTMARFWGVNRTAAYLMVPYLLWVSFASILNYHIWMLNP